MSAPFVVWIVWSVGGLSVGLAALGWVLLGLSGHVPDDAHGDHGVNPLISLVFVLFLVVGALIVAREHRHPIGWLLWGSAVSALLGVSGLGYGYVAYALEGRSPSLPGVAWVAWVCNWSNSASLAALGLIFLLFPTGRWPSAAWRSSGRGAAFLTVAVGLVTALRPGPMDYFPSIYNPLGLEGAAGELATIAQTVAVVWLTTTLLLISAISLLFRSRRARGVERQQIKWFAYSATLMALVFAAGAVEVLVGPELGAGTAFIWLFGVAWALAVATMPLAIGIAVLRFRLYEIDRLINRTLVYGLLTVGLGLTYWASVALLQQVLRPLIQGSDLAIVGSTLAVAALFQPLRVRIQLAVDRRFYRQRYDATRTLEAFSSRLRHEVDLDSLGAELLAVVGQTMQPERLSLWLRPPADRSRG
jgi:hypothetical protein